MKSKFQGQPFQDGMNQRFFEWTIFRIVSSLGTRFFHQKWHKLKKTSSRSPSLFSYPRENSWLFTVYLLGLAPAAWWASLLVTGRIRIISVAYVNDPIRWRGKYTNDQSECSIASVKMFEKYKLYFLSISCWTGWLRQAVTMFLFLCQCIKYQWWKYQITTDDVRIGFDELESVRVFSLSAVTLF